MAFPPCINIHRCDGCCNKNEQCAPIGQHEVKLQKVGIINFDGESQPEYDETIVTVMNHTECQCQCQWKSNADCRNINQNFVLNPHACECICPEEIPCDAKHEFHQNTCSCKCKDSVYGRLEQNCIMRGFKWNDALCKCEAVKATVNKPVFSRQIRIID